MGTKVTRWIEIGRPRDVVSLTAIVAILTVILSSPTMIQPALAHAETTLSVNIDEHPGKSIAIVVGHSNEPAYGAEPGLSDGRHGIEVSLSDNATGLPIGDAQPKADKYYFTDLQSFERATSVEQADQIQKEVEVRPVFGETGRYTANQIVEDGIYGYRIYGNITYFDVANITIDTTIFCTPSDDEEGKTTKFNSPGWSGSFGCPVDIKTIAFPTDKSALAEPS